MMNRKSIGGKKLYIRLLGIVCSMTVLFACIPAMPVEASQGTSSIGFGLTEDTQEGAGDAAIEDVEDTKLAFPKVKVPTVPGEGESGSYTTSGVFSSGAITSDEKQKTEEKGQEQEAQSQKSTILTANVRELLTEQYVGAALLFAEKDEVSYLEAKEESIGASWGYTNLGISNVKDNLNIRSIPQEDGKLVGKLPANAACECLEEDGDWTHIKSGEVEGYVKTEYLLLGVEAKQRVRETLKTYVVSNTGGLNVREEPNTDAEIITQVAEGEALEYIETQGEWVKAYLDDQEIYMFADYVSIEETLNTAITMTEVLYGAGVSDIRANLCQYAMKWLGNPYVWGGVSLTKGADCSGFVLSVFKNFGMNLPHSSRSQATMGTTIKLSQAQPGDLVFYGNGKRINHVAIYIGNGMIVHASNPRTGIRTSGVYYRTPVKCVRIIND